MLIDVGGITSRYDKTGSGSPVIILHGWACTIDNVRPIMQCVSRYNTVYGIDFPGFGQSQQPTTTWGVFDYAEWLAAFMELVGCPCADLIGHSFGGRVAIAVAARYPNLVSRMVLVDSPGIRHEPSPSAQRRVNLFKVLRRSVNLIPFTSMREKLLSHIYASFGSADYRKAGAMRDIFVRVVNEDLRPLLPEILAPTLLIWGENDEDVPVADGKLMAHEIPDARLEILQGAGHFSYADRLPQFCRLVRDFLVEGMT